MQLLHGVLDCKLGNKEAHKQSFKLKRHILSVYRTDMLTILKLKITQQFIAENQFTSDVLKCVSKSVAKDN